MLVLIAILKASIIESMALSQSFGGHTVGEFKFFDDRIELIQKKGKKKGKNKSFSYEDFGYFYFHPSQIKTLNQTRTNFLQIKSFDPIRVSPTTRSILANIQKRIVNSSKKGLRILSIADLDCLRTTPAPDFKSNPPLQTLKLIKEWQSYLSTLKEPPPAILEQSQNYIESDELSVKIQLEKGNTQKNRFVRNYLLRYCNDFDLVDKPFKPFENNREVIQGLLNTYKTICESTFDFFVKNQFEAALVNRRFLERIAEKKIIGRSNIENSANKLLIHNWSQFEQKQKHPIQTLRNLMLLMAGDPNESHYLQLLEGTPDSKIKNIVGALSHATLGEFDPALKNSKRKIGGIHSLSGLNELWWDFTMNGHLHLIRVFKNKRDFDTFFASKPDFPYFAFLQYGDPYKIPFTLYIYQPEKGFVAEQSIFPIAFEIMKESKSVNKPTIAEKCLQTYRSPSETLTSTHQKGGFRLLSISKDFTTEVRTSSQGDMVSCFPRRNRTRGR